MRLPLAARPTSMTNVHVTPRLPSYLMTDPCMAVSVRCVAGRHGCSVPDGDGLGSNGVTGDAQDFPHRRVLVGVHVLRAGDHGVLRRGRERVPERELPLGQL